MKNTKGLVITGTDTDIGKTIATAALLRALRLQGFNAQAVKIIQTGIADNLNSQGLAGDAQIYQTAIADLPKTKLAGAKVFRTFALAASPHLAAQKMGVELQVDALQAEIKAYQTASEADILLYETAGGLKVPLNATEDMLDLLKALNFKVILCAKNCLGAINHTLLSLQALQAAGLTTRCLVLNLCQNPALLGRDERIILEDNSQILANRLANYYLHNKDKACVIKLPYIDFTKQDCWDQAASYFDPLCASLKGAQQNNEAELLHNDQQLLWHPYTRYQDPGPIYAVDTAYDNKIVLKDGRELIDGMSSWWCAIHGYRHPKLVAAIAAQAAKLSHIMFGGFTHEPAVTLAQRLLKHLPAKLQAIFFCDSGSVAVEVALKMALQYHVKRKPKKRFFLTPYGGYHGDTFGAMAVCDPVNGMHHLFQGVLPKNFFMPRPPCPFGQTFDPKSLEPAKQIMLQHKEEIAAIILEPIVQGAGGMWFYHQDYLKGLANLAKENDCLLIFDEIATGFGHTGRFFALEWADVCPDILCLGKALTGGMLSLAATTTTEEVATKIQEDGQVLMHGPTFMANPLACAAALAGLDLLEENRWPTQVQTLATTMRNELAKCRKLASVKDVRVLGGIGVVETKTQVNQALLIQYFTNHGVWIRPFNNLVYLMPPYISHKDDVARLCQTIYAGLKYMEAQG